MCTFCAMQQPNDPVCCVCPCCLQALAFLLLPHCGQLPALAATYAVAALTFNAITTGEFEACI